MATAKMRKTIGKLLGIAPVVTFGLLFAIPQAVCNSVNETGIEANIAAMVANIRGESNPDIRVEATRRLSLFIHSQERTDLDGLNPETIGAIASSLTDKLVEVRAWTAIALGDIGPTASGAVPALENALKYVDPGFENSIFGKIGPSSSADAEIHDALQKIRGKPTEPNRDR